MSIWKWSDHWRPEIHPDHHLSLGEGDTPLLRSRRIGPALGLPNLFFKVETGQPTGSYKDRFAAVAVADMLARGCHTCLATSSGNTGAALAAYCAAAGIHCRVSVVETAPEGKLRQMRAYGAEVVREPGFGADEETTRRIFEGIVEAGRQPGVSFQISAYCLSPAGMQGVESIAFELAGQLTGVEPAHVFCPAGGGGLTLAVARGFAKIGRAAAVHCVQPLGNDTIAGALRSGAQRAAAIEGSSTGISGLQVPSVLDGDEVIAACRASGGSGHLVEDAAAREFRHRLATEEGIFTETAGAVALAGLVQAVSAGEVRAEDTLVALVTGSGFKESAPAAG
jgi:threonine synthase